MKKLLPSLLVALLATGCTVGPDYKRPTASVPTAYRGPAPEEAAKTDSASLGEQKRWEVFQDTQLQSLIRTALQQNFDVRIAATRILEAQAQVGLARANQFPAAAVIAGATDTRNAKSKFLSAYDTSNSQLGLGF